MIKLTGEEYFILGLSRLQEGNSSEAEECFKEGANLYHSKCMLKLAKITQDESYYELAAYFGEGEAIRWVIEKLIAEKNYEAALTKLDDYAVDSEDELRYETTFKMLDDKWTAGTISTDEMITLADLYERGKGTEKNPQKARELRDRAEFIKTESAAAAGDVDAIRWVIRKLNAEKNYKAALTKLNDYAVGNEDELRYETTFKMLDDKWTAGTISTDEMITLADLYERGKGTEKNPQKARELRDRAEFINTSFAAAVGDAGSMFQLGKMYLHGDGAEKDIAEAKAWFGKATQAGNVEAKTELDKITTFESLRHKEDWELNVDELHQLAGFYEEGLLCQKDKSMAMQLRILANFKETKAEADNGKPEAVYEIANRYLTGHGVEKNLYEAAKYVEKYSKLKPENYYKLRELYNLLSQGFKEMADDVNPSVKPSKTIQIDRWGVVQIT